SRKISSKQKLYNPMKKVNSLFAVFVIVNCAIYFQIEAAFATSSLSPSIQSEQKTGFNFAAVGDMGCSPLTEKIINDINNKSPEVILALGDLSYQRDNSDCWLNIVAPVEPKLKIVLGDHDYDSDSVLKQYKNHFNMSQEYYSFNYENVHFIALATEIPFDINSSQYNFVKNDLEAASKNPDINWTIVYSYRPQYSSPSEHPGNNFLRDLYHPLFQKYNVDIILQAHNHNYQRTYPINYNNESSSSPLVTDNDIKSYKDPAGQVYVTVGTGGSVLHDLSGKARYMAVQYLAFGFLDISITSNGRNLTGTFYDSSDGTIKDHFTVIK
ncbi:MAG: metallophosphoesterase, partial [Nitrososphaeraceae archaeon]